MLHCIICFTISLTYVFRDHMLPAIKCCMIPDDAVEASYTYCYYVVDIVELFSSEIVNILLSIMFLKPSSFSLIFLFILLSNCLMYFRITWRFEYLNDLLNGKSSVGRLSCNIQSLSTSRKHSLWSEQVITWKAVLSHAFTVYKRLNKTNMKSMRVNHLIYDEPSVVSPCLWVNGSIILHSR